MAPIVVVLSDESVNDYGFRVLTSGIDTSLFEKNPIMLYNHHRSSSWGDDKILPIGKWENIKKEGGRLLATPVFDEDDEFAMKVKSKFEKGILNSASIGFKHIATSEEKSMMLPGQSRPTVTQCKLWEVSIADIPGNSNCHKLSHNGKMLTLSADTAPDELDNILPTIQQKEEKMDNDLKLVAETLGMKDASIAQVVAKVTEINNQVATLSAENSTLKTQLADLQKETTTTKVTSLIDAALSSGKITEAQKAVWTNMAEKDFDNTKLALDGMQAYEPITKKVEIKDGDSSVEALAARFDELDKEGKLSSLSDEERDILTKAKSAMLRKSGKAK